MNPIRLAIFASGSGSNAENIYHYFSGNDKVEIALILSDKSQAFVHQRAIKMGVVSKPCKRLFLKNPMKSCLY